ncbi:hypothetical protein Pse7367_1994 [Thalassoporum mexicanum PCC 7367]|uniref:helix-turn-helix domain-containing protein n=1 Tax=Thalassoporum mexicanum TaxID=3457544 RepID=UPI00029FF050|nr:hypothetical protein Pse7367_1994 [Pseudanabaena sp. PCC 7367]
MAETYYELTTEELIRSCHELTGAEQGVYFYLQASSIEELTLKSISEDLNFHKSTVSRAIKQLRNKGWLNVSVVRAGTLRIDPYPENKN